MNRVWARRIATPRSCQHLRTLTWSQHVVPAAYPRLKKESTTAGKDGNESRLQLSVDRYRLNTTTGKSGPGQVILFNHANGSHKETWRHVIDRVAQKLKSRSAAHSLTDMLSFDCVNHGDSAVLNHGKLGSTFFWPDYGRDAAQVVESMLPDNEVVGVGHSFGATALLSLAQSRPDFFKALVVIEPVLMKGDETEERRAEVSTKLGEMAERRKDSWQNLEEVERYLKSKPLFQAWHPEAVENYLRYGFYQKPDRSEWTLKCPKAQEAICFTKDIETRIQVFQKLPDLPRSLPVLVVFGSETTFFPNAREMFDHIASRIPNARIKEVPGAGHLSVQEKPDEVASLLYGFLADL